MLRLFETSLHAKLYAQFRPDPPVSLINSVVRFVKEGGLPLERAVDVGCGSGQNTRCLAAHFNSVLATDISPAQIAEARASNTTQSIEYRESPAGKIPTSDSSVQLVTASQCCHFFDLPRFFTEVDRVLAPAGVIALYGYNMPEFYRDGQPWTQMDDVIKQALEATAEFWSRTRQEVADKYAEPKFRIPYPGEIREEQHYREQKASVDSVLGKISTWSGLQTMVKRCGEQRGEAVLRQAREGFVSVLSKDAGEVDTSATNLTTRYYYFLLMARKPATS